jgi:diguanylate cyclase (GGDEF)-like protein/PAS domain S-box-containing protein
MVKKILIIDNNPVIVKLLSSTLEKEGYEVLTASDGLSAFDILQNVVPDIIFLDLIMPNINGEQLSRIMYGMDKLKNTPIILISGVAAEAKVGSDIKGIDGCIAKGPNLKKFVLDTVQQFDSGVYKKTAEVKGCDEVYPREVSRELLETNRHFKVVLHNMSEGMVELTQENRIIFANPAVCDLVGLPEEKLLAMDFTDLFENEDRKKIRQLLSQIADKPVSLDEEEALFLKENHLAIQVIPVFDNGHQTIIIILRNITARKEAQKHLRETKDFLSTVLNTVQAGILIIDAETRIVIDANPVALNMFGLKKNDIEGKECHDIICPKERGECPIIDQNALSHKGVRSLVDNNGKETHVLKTATVCTINDKNYIVESFIDITEQKILEEKLHRQSITDDLTGLLNRRGFLMMAKKQIEIADRNKRSLHLLFADVDNLKWINDNYGHEAGDKAIIHASKILRSFRSSDIVGRMGGDEFALLVTGDEAENSKNQIEKRFNDLIEKGKNEFGEKFQLAMSYGIVRYNPSTPCTIEELIFQADHLMYECKKERQS